jgi:hypothetical protein
MECAYYFDFCRPCQTLTIPKHHNRSREKITEALFVAREDDPRSGSNRAEEQWIDLEWNDSKQQLR